MPSELDIVASLPPRPEVAEMSAPTPSHAVRCRVRDELSRIQEVEAVYFAVEEGEPLFLVFLTDERFNRELRQRVHDVGHHLEDEFPGLYFRFECFSRRARKRIPLRAEEVFDNTNQ